MANDLSSKLKYLPFAPAGGGAISFSPLREMLGYDPFRFTNVDPEIDIVRTDRGFDVEVPVAGFAPSQIELVVKDDLLTIAGKNERRSFTRSLRIPEDVDAANIEATVEHGMLALKLQRHPDAQPRRIQVKNAS